jgi:hypothetical protein
MAKKAKFKFDWDAQREKANTETKSKSKNNLDDPRFYKIKRKEDGCAEVVIRFLPAPDGMPYVKTAKHWFQDKGGYYIKNCPSLVKGYESCPVCKYNGEIYNQFGDDKQGARSAVGKKNRQVKYISNILVVNDPQSPENNGKVFLFEYGQKIFKKIDAAWNPPKDSIRKKLEVFDYYDGANFNLIVTQESKKDSWPNYDESNFDTPSQIYESDDDIEKVHNKIMPIQEFIAEDKFETFESLSARFNKVMGFGAPDSAGKSTTKSEAKVETKSQQEADSNILFDDDDDSDDNWLQDLQNVD